MQLFIVKEINENSIGLISELWGLNNTILIPNVLKKASD
jgi:hypothetical protein